MSGVLVPHARAGGTLRGVVKYLTEHQSPTRARAARITRYLLIFQQIQSPARARATRTDQGYQRIDNPRMVPQSHASSAHRGRLVVAQPTPHTLQSPRRPQRQPGPARASQAGSPVRDARASSTSQGSVPVGGFPRCASLEHRTRRALSVTHRLRTGSGPVVNW